MAEEKEMMRELEFEKDGFLFSLIEGWHLFVFKDDNLYDAVQGTRHELIEYAARWPHEGSPKPLHSPTRQQIEAA